MGCTMGKAEKPAKTRVGESSGNHSNQKVATETVNNAKTAEKPNSVKSTTTKPNGSVAIGTTDTNTCQNNSGQTADRPRGKRDHAFCMTTVNMFGVFQLAYDLWVPPPATVTKVILGPVLHEISELEKSVIPIFPNSDISFDTGKAIDAS